jgi:hypothetical protein
MDDAGICANNIVNQRRLVQMDTARANGPMDERVKYSAVTICERAEVAETRTEEEIRQARVAQEERMVEVRRLEAVRAEEYKKQQEEEQLARKEAQERAKSLLKSVLAKEQLERFERDECIPVDTAKGNRYLIKKGRSANINVLDVDGKCTHRLCAHPVSDVPDYDTMLAQLLYLRSDEEAFLKMANRHAAPMN